MLSNKIIILLFLGILRFNALAQFTDDFSDGDFVNNPTWFGDSSLFIVNSSEELQLNGLSASDSVFLSLPNSAISMAEWRFWIKLSFSPSDNNHVKVYLVTDKSDLLDNLNGYYVRMGENGSSDGIDLFKQSGNTHTKIIDGINGHVSNSTNTLRIKVTRDSLGFWQLYSDTIGGSNYKLEGSVVDNTFNLSFYFGIVCKHTSSNASKFYFDDFYAGPILIDSVSPYITSVNVISSTELDIWFSEEVEETSSETLANYFVNNGIGNPQNASRDQDSAYIVHLTFSTPFSSEMLNTITINDIKDFNDNIIISNTSETFLYYELQAFDVVINEILIDETPQINLPEFEFVELLNRTTFPIDLSQWILSVGTSSILLPKTTIYPDSFLILTSAEGETFLQSYGHTLGLESFPALTNTGAELVLRDNLGRLISSVFYKDSWYGDDVKQEGGWTLEQIDSDNPCGDALNWKASINITGGTPGKENSVKSNNKDFINPGLLRASVPNDSTVHIFFDEAIDSTSLFNNSQYHINYSIGNPVSVKSLYSDYSQLELLLANKLNQNIIYTLTITDTLKDCVGNLLKSESKLQIALPQQTNTSDIIINEVLFNPEEGGVDFVEIYNRSNKVLELKDLRLANADYDNGELETIKAITEDEYLLFPKDYIVLTSDPASVKKQYYSSNPRGFIEVFSMPSYNTDKGIVVLTNTMNEKIDEFKYSEEMHYPLLKSFKGVSLERLNSERSSADSTNWHSAAGNVGYATPAYKNSQYNDLLTNANEEVWVQPELFSPDNDGYNDVININYKFGESGQLTNIFIYDAKGRLVRTLIKSELSGNEGIFSWDGISDDGEKVKIGIYIIYFESISLKGKITQYKRACVVGSKLN